MAAAATRSQPGGEPAAVPERGDRAPIHEVFTSVQGEGLHVGEPQTFLRLAGCPLRCRWCDTPAALDVPPDPGPDPGPGAGPAASREATARIGRPGAWRRAAAWTTPFGAALWIAEVEGDTPRTISVTGGEPLLWPGFLERLAGLLPGRRLHLETAGAHPGELARVRDVFAHVSLDLKLPRDLDAPTEPGLPHGADAWRDARRRCLELVRDRDACAKVVVAGGREASEFYPLLEDVAERAEGLPLFLQPVTPMAGIAAPRGDLVLELVRRALALGLRTRVVPQVHRVLRLH